MKHCVLHIAKLKKKYLYDAENYHLFQWFRSSKFYRRHEPLIVIVLLYFNLSLEAE